MNAVDIPFGEWLPSAPDFKNPGLRIATNVIPIPGGYGPQPGLVAVENETDIAGDARGAALFFSVDGSVVIVGGTATSLFKDDSGTISATTGLTDIGSGESWDFCQFNDIIIATSISNAVKHLDDIDTDTTWGNLGGSPPNARYCARVADFVMLGNIASAPNRIQWSAFNAPGGTWGIDRATQAGYADLPREFGNVQRVVGGRFPMVFQERGVSRIDYVGPPTVWRITEIEQQRGAIAPFSVITVGFVTYFLAQDGFWATDGSTFQPIGSQRVNRWFFDNVEAERISEIHAAIDMETESIVWAYHGAGSNEFNKIIRYSWSERRWSSGDFIVARLVEDTTGGTTLEQIGAAFGSLSAVPISLDDPRWRQRGRVLSAYVDDGTNTVRHTFSGSALAASVETGEFQPAPGRRVSIGGARAHGFGGQNWTTSAVKIGNDRAVEYTPYSPAGADGFCPLRGDAQTMRLAMFAAAGAEWRDIQGAQVRFRVSGKR